MPMACQKYSAMHQVHTYVHMYVCMCVYVCMYVCTHVCTHVCMYACIYMYVRMYQGFIQRGGPWNFPYPEKVPPPPADFFLIKSSCPSADIIALPLLVHNVNLTVKKSNFCSACSMRGSTSPSHTLPLTMVYQPHGFPSNKKVSPHEKNPV